MSVQTNGKGLVAITGELNAWLHAQSASDGLLTLFIRHTSASLTIQENTDPDVLADLTDAFDRIAPESVRYRHSLEGPDDMPAHVKTVVSGVSLQVPVRGGRLDLGTWQAVYVFEHRAFPHTRSISIHYLGE